MGNKIFTQQFNGIYQNKKVFLTGHTGFKGSWLAFWLTKMGAKVCGYALEAPTTPNHFAMLNLDMKSVIGDIRDREKLNCAINDFQPEIIFHLAAQPLVRDSYDDPITTYETNVIGTLNLFEAARKCDSVRAILNVTTDKCYENQEWVWGYRENEPMGGFDPYSSSKGCSEILTSSYRRSFFQDGKILLASARAGNVIGGGDWAKDRLIPDIVKATAEGKTSIIRNPHATRPWQHVLEPLSGYLLLGQNLLEGNKAVAEGWNFGPTFEGEINVEQVAKQCMKNWNEIKFEIMQDKSAPHEANYLKLDISKAQGKLHWSNTWNVDETFARTISWYKNYYQNGILNTLDDLTAFVGN